MFFDGAPLAFARCSLFRSTIDWSIQFEFFLINHRITTCTVSNLENIIFVRLSSDAFTLKR